MEEGSNKHYDNKNLVISKVHNILEVLDEIKSVKRKDNNYEKSKSMFV